MPDPDKITTIRPISILGTRIGPEVSIGSDDRHVLIFTAPTPFDAATRLALDYRTAALVMMAVCERLRVHQLAEDLETLEIESRPLPRMATWGDVRSIVGMVDLDEMHDLLLDAQKVGLEEDRVAMLHDAAAALTLLQEVAEHGFLPAPSES